MYRSVQGIQNWKNDMNEPRRKSSSKSSQDFKNLRNFSEQKLFARRVLWTEIP